MPTRPADFIYRTGTVTAFVALHQYPGNPVNVLVIPNEHFESVYELSASLGTPLMEATSLVARALKVAFACDGVSTRQHNEPAGSQDVWHFHQHVTARYTGDRLYARLTTEKSVAPELERADAAALLREAIAALTRE